MAGHGYIVTMDEDYYMGICLDEAGKAFENGEVPVGAVLVCPDVGIVSKTHNLTITRNSPSAHAEMLAIEEASSALGNHRLLNCTLFVSKEPCIMCAGAIIEARLKRVVFGCYDTKRGALGSVIDVNALPFNHKVEIQGGLLEDESRTLLQKFFQARRGTEAVVTGPTRNRLYAL
jgi:tRNA(adenine34) deaminase